MPELSNLLRQKLGEAQNGGEKHPDADTLTALMEQLLPAAERQQVLAHLAACGQCREIFALSQPQLPEMVSHPVFKPSRVSRWRRLFTPTFGLAATGAAMAVIAVLVLQLPQNSKQQAQPEAKVTQPASAPAEARPNSDAASKSELDDSLNAAQPAARNQASSHPAPIGASAGVPRAKSAPANIASASRGFADKDVINRESAPAANAPVLAANLKKRDFVNTGIFAATASESYGEGQTVNGLPAAPSPQPLASEARFNTNTSGQITIFQDIPPSLASNRANANVRLLTPPPPPDHFNCPMCKKVGKSARSVWRRLPGTTPAISTNSLSFSAMGGQGKFSADLQKEQPAEVAAAPEKPATMDGLQRFEALSSRSMAAGTASAGDSAALWKVMGGKLVRSSGPGQWEEAYPGASFQFSFVSARGSEVWAGGTHAAIIHSRDGGKTWEAPKLDEQASGSIVSILFSGNIVQVRTSDGQSWASSDGGKTWAQN